MLSSVTGLRTGNKGTTMYDVTDCKPGYPCAFPSCDLHYSVTLLCTIERKPMARPLFCSTSPCVL